MSLTTGRLTAGNEERNPRRSSVYIRSPVYTISRAFYQSATMDTSTVSRKGQIVIPARLRRKLGLAEGTRVLITESGGGLHVQPLDRGAIERFAGLLPQTGDAVRALLAERTRDRDREEGSR
jgi:AbrB family looped-hinge helix DNA binding protein